MPLSPDARGVVGASARGGFAADLVLARADGEAVWIVSRQPECGRRTQGVLAWECRVLCRLGFELPSAWIQEATNATYAAWGQPPPDGLIVAAAPCSRIVDDSRGFGWAFFRAGWRPVRVDGSRLWLRAPPLV